MIWSAFVIGLLGSLHCVGMCGPLALAVPSKPGHRIVSAALFNSGRILMYGLIGVFFGIVGYGLHLAGFQSYLSIFAGVSILIFLLFPHLENRLNSKYNFRFSGYIRKKFSGLIKKKTYSSIFTMGLLNGLLPCGLIYIAVAGALETGYVETAAIYMIFFGLGTTVLLFLTFISREVIQKIKFFRPKRLVPYLTGLIAILFITRGILYMIPPDLNELASIQFLQKITMCHGL